MAEAWARVLLADIIEPYSAGTAPKVLDPLAIDAMIEAGVDISGQRSKSVDDFKGTAFGLVVTVCSAADENCPVFTGAKRNIHAPFDDPPRLAKGAKTREEALTHYRRVRDEIREFIAGLPEMIGAEK
ncbi:MAG: arsenate reductase ArsC [Deltaproteobacteria bacterium]|nr:arsenate reductase ArsC [Deltaproteobacteria bacterium]